MADLPGRPLTERAVWTAAELAADPGWVVRWTGDELAELDALAKTVLERRAPVPGFGVGDVAGVFSEDPHGDGGAPKLWARARRIRRELNEGRGCVLIKGLDVARRDRREIEAMYWALGIALGRPVHQNGLGEQLIEVSDRGEDYAKPKTRGYTNRSALKFHCDGADVVGLLCLHPAKEGGQSYISSALAIYNEILESRPELLGPLGDGFYFHLRGEGVTKAADEITRRKVPVFSARQGRVSCRYIRKTILDGQRVAGEPLDGLALEAVEHLAALADDPRFRFAMDFEPGDIQLLNNHVVLHARSDFIDWPELERKRRLLRLWVNLDEGRPVVDAVADRYNAGPHAPMVLRDDVETVDA